MIIFVVGPDRMIYDFSLMFRRTHGDDGKPIKITGDVEQLRGVDEQVIIVYDDRYTLTWRDQQDIDFARYRNREWELRHGNSSRNDPNPSNRGGNIASALRVIGNGLEEVARGDVFDGRSSRTGYIDSRDGYVPPKE